MSDKKIDSNDLTEYKYNGARSLVLLHEEHLRSVLKTWREAKSQYIELPETDDSDYQSLDTLLFHLFRAANGYMTWICEKLELPDPGISSLPELENIENEAEEYLDHLLRQWRVPLQNIEENKFYSPAFKSHWNVDYCIDAMLEHAVMHPIRHEFQLKTLLNR